jgi:cell division protein FtsB
MNFRREIRDSRQIAVATGKSGTDLVSENAALRQENEALKKENRELRAKYSNVQRLVHSLSRLASLSLSLHPQHFYSIVVPDRRL